MSTVACFCHFNGLWGSDCRFKAPPQRACFPGYSYMLHCRLISFIHLISLQKYWQVYKPPHKLSFGHHTSLVCQEAVPLDTPVITYDTQLINGINSINSIIISPIKTTNNQNCESVWVNFSYPVSALKNLWITSNSMA